MSGLGSGRLQTAVLVDNRVVSLWRRPSLCLRIEVSAMIFHLSEAYFGSFEGSLYDHRVTTAFLTTGRSEEEGQVDTRHRHIWGCCGRRLPSVMLMTPPLPPSSSQTLHRWALMESLERGRACKHHRQIAIL